MVLRKGVKDEGVTRCAPCVGSWAESTPSGQLSGNTAKVDALPFGLSEDSSPPVLRGRLHQHPFLG